MKQSKPLSASILIALALFLSAAASGSGDKSQHQATHHQSAAKDQSAYRPQPPTIIIEPAPVRIIQPAPAAEKQTIRQKWYQRPSITDWGVLVVTAVYALISLGLLKATLRQARGGHRRDVRSGAGAIGRDRGGVRAVDSDLRLHHQLTGHLELLRANLGGPRSGVG
jgi:hypothetical protein